MCFITYHVRLCKVSAVNLQSFMHLAPDLSPSEHLRDLVEQQICMNMQLTNLQQLCGAVMSALTRSNISSTLLSHEAFRLIWGQKGSYPVSEMCT